MKPNKRILPLIAAVVCIPISVYAHGLGKAGLINADWTPIQVGAWPFSVFLILRLRQIHTVLR